MTVSQVGQKSLPFGEVVEDSIQHKSLFFIMAIVLSLSIYAYKKVSIKVTKE